MNIHLLLAELKEYPTGKTAASLARHFQVSSATVKNFIQSLRRQLKEEAGCEILGKSGAGNGYYLTIHDHQKYAAYMQLNVDVEDEWQGFNNQQQRIQYLLYVLLTTKHAIKSDDLIEQLSISRTQLSRDLVHVKQKLQKLNLSLEDRPYYGMMLNGTEFNKRLILAEYYKKHQKFLDYFKTGYFEQHEIVKVISTLKEIVVEKANYYDYKLSDITCQNIIVHLFVAINRIYESMDIELDVTMIESLKSEEEFPLAVAIVEAVSENFNVKFNENEVYYMVIHLSSKRIVDEKNFIIDAEIQILVDKILKRISNEFDVDFRNNLNLRIMLSLHLSPLLLRIKYGTVMKNPLLDEIKENLWLAYDFALCVVSVINEEYKCFLSEDEIGYFALHLKVALDQIYVVDKKRILLVCSTGRGSAELLKNDFKKRFGNSIDVIESHNVFDLENIDFTKFDYIFTTVPIEQHVPIPIFSIGQFMDGSMEENIKGLLMDKNIEDFKQIFDQRFFFKNIHANNKVEVISEMVARLRKITNIPETFINEVLIRESFASTDFGNGVVFPHPNRHLTDESFISIAVLEKPIIWEKNKVQVIILSSFEKGFLKKHPGAMNVISSLITNKALIHEIVMEPEYETLIRIVESLASRGGK